MQDGAGKAINRWNFRPVRNTAYAGGKDNMPRCHFADAAFFAGQRDIP